MLIENMVAWSDRSKGLTAVRKATGDYLRFLNQDIGFNLSIILPEDAERIMASLQSPVLAGPTGSFDKPEMALL